MTLVKATIDHHHLNSENVSAAKQSLLTLKQRWEREVIEWLEKELKRIDKLITDTQIKRDQIVTDRRVALALYVILKNYKATLQPTDWRIDK